MILHYEKGEKPYHECNQSPILRKQLNESTAVDGYNSTLIWVLSVSC